MPDLAATPHELECAVAHYDWGDREFLPALLGRDFDGKPCAELWVGAHPARPSRVRVGKGEVGLDQVFANQPGLLGTAVQTRFGELPFLAKILCAAAPLSIQVHPSVGKARAGFERENAEGIPLTARERNYADPNHKPELLVALTPFIGLRGFRPLEQIANTLASFPTLKPFESSLRHSGLAGLYQALMNLPQAQVNATLSPIVERARGVDDSRDPLMWLAHAAERFHGPDGHDRGLFSVLLLNLIHLAPGEAMYLPAGVLHAYLRGTGIEVMANSNNVLRGGLTPKHVDVPELIDNVEFRGETPEIVRAQPTAAPSLAVYPTDCPEFALQRWSLHGDHSATADTVQVLLLIEGDATLTFAGQTSSIRPGHPWLIPAGVTYAVTGQDVDLYRVVVPRS